MKYFTMNEFECHCGCRMPDSARANVVALVEAVLDPAREILGRPVTVNSGSRCGKHNREVGGVSASQHLRGEAADITAGSPEENKRLAEILEQNGKYDQMIKYLNKDDGIRFVHVSWKRFGPNRHQVLRKAKTS